MMKPAVVVGSGFLAFALLIAGCADTPCRQLRHPELANTAPEAKAATEATPTSDGRIFVARPDGSLQCGMDKGESVEDMEKALKGIKVYSRTKRPDGKMHIQVCGSATGTMNVYEIPASSLTEAENRGFKKFIAP